MDVLTALALAFILGIGILSAKAETLYKATCELRDIVMLTITKTVVPLLPLYIFGIFLNMTAEGTVASVLGVFIKVIGVVFALHILWLVFLYLIAGTIEGFSGTVEEISDDKRRLKVKISMFGRDTSVELGTADVSVETY